MSAANDAEISHRETVHSPAVHLNAFLFTLYTSAELWPGKADVGAAQERGESGDHQGGAQRP